MSNLVDFAKKLLHHAEALQAQLDKANAAQPSLDAGGPSRYPDRVEHPEIYKARTALVDASKDMYYLALGPIDTLRTMVGPERCNMTILRVLHTYDIPGIITKHGSLSFGDLAAEAGVNAEVLERILRLAFATNLFKEEPKGYVSHTALSQAFPVVADWIALNSRDDYSLSLLHWDDAIKVYTEPRPQGQRVLPFNIANKTDAPFFDYVTSDPAHLEIFGKAMTSAGRMNGGDDLKVFLGDFDWAQFGEGPLVDLGGGNGYISAAIARANPQLHLLVQDLPSNEPNFNNMVPDYLKNRVTYQAQDFFQPQAKQLGARAFFMKAIMHDWPDYDAARILRHLIPDVEKGAKILVSDRILGATGHKPTHFESFGQFSDLLMFTVTGAKERNLEQWKTLFHLTDERLKILGWHQPAGSEFGLIEVGM